MFWWIWSTVPPCWLSVVPGGDFNAMADHPSHQIWREHWSDAADVGAEHRGHKETPRDPCQISGSDIFMTSRG